MRVLLVRCVLFFCWFSGPRVLAGEWTLHRSWAIGDAPVVPFDADDTLYAGSGEVVHILLWVTSLQPMGPPPTCFDIHKGPDTFTSTTGDYYFTSGSVHEVFFHCPVPMSKGEFTLIFQEPQMIPTGIDETQNTGMRIFPTVFTDHFTVEVGSEDMSVELSVADMTGQVVFDRRSGGSGTQQYDLSALSVGVYVVRARTARGSLVQRVVKTE